MHILNKHTSLISNLCKESYWWSNPQFGFYFVSSDISFRVKRTGKRCVCRLISNNGAVFSTLSRNFTSLFQQHNDLKHCLHNSSYVRPFIVGCKTIYLTQSVNVASSTVSILANRVSMWRMMCTYIIETLIDWPVERLLYQFAICLNVMTCLTIVLLLPYCFG